MYSEINLELIDTEIRKAVTFLSQWPGVRRIWLFGSAARNRRLDWRSDLDFAVEGMDATEQCRAWAELDERMTIPCDLIRWETADPVLRGEIFRSGKVLYEA
jgi:predicted nucleotidyltransferase